MDPKNIFIGFEIFFDAYFPLLGLTVHSLTEKLFASA